MKIAVTGKGGVGKTTLTSLLAFAFAARGDRVLAIDADPSPCLGPALGITPERLADLTPIAEMDELIYERTGAQPGTSGGYFKLNPRVDDLPDRFSVEQDGIRLLMMGAIEMGGSGCICPESAILRSLMTHVLLRRDEVVLVDLYAGVEHLGRATAQAVDAMLIVVEPTARSLATGFQIRALAADLGIERLYAVGSKVESRADQDYIGEGLSEGARRQMGLDGALPLLGFLPNDPAVRIADRTGRAVYHAAPLLAESAREMVCRLRVGLD